MKWVEAVKAFNAKKGGAYHVPRKGTAEYDEVMKIMGKGEIEVKEANSNPEMVEKRKRVRGRRIGKEIDTHLAPTPASTLTTSVIRKVVKVGKDMGVLPMVYGKSGYKINIETI